MLLKYDFRYIFTENRFRLAPLSLARMQHISFTKKEMSMSPEVNRGKKFRIMGQISNIV